MLDLIFLPTSLRILRIHKLAVNRSAIAVRKRTFPFGVAKLQGLPCAFFMEYFVSSNSR